MRRRHSPRIAWLVITMLVMQPWLGLFAYEGASAQTTALVICTGSGFKVIELPDGIGPSSEPSDRRQNDAPHGLDCAACLVQALAQHGSPGAPGLDAPPGRQAASALFADRHPSARTCYSPLQSRAPPVA